MPQDSFFANMWVWLAVTIFLFGLATFLPIKIKNDGLRPWIYWVILIPVSLVIILYVYPVGTEVFRRLAVNS